MNLSFLSSIVEFFKHFGSDDTNLEAYIKSKNPTNQSELEHWMKVWEYESRVKMRNMY